MAINLEDIQKGSVTMGSASTSQTVTISSVDLAGDKALLKFTVRSLADAPSNGLIVGDINSSTQIEFRRSGIGGQVFIDWQVIPFTAGSSIIVEQIEATSVSPGDTSTISDVGATSRAYPVCTYRNGGSSINFDDFWRVEFNSTTEIEYQADPSSGALETIVTFVISSPNLSTQFNSVLATTSTSFTSSITTVDENRSFIVGYSEESAGATDLRDLASLEFQDDSTLEWTRLVGNSKDFFAYTVEMPTNWATDFSSVQYTSTFDTITISITDEDKTYLTVGTGDNLGNGRVNESTNDIDVAQATYDMTSTTNVDVDRITSGPEQTALLWAVEQENVATEAQPERSYPRGNERGTLRGVI